jgi:alpha-glucosidase (family GH31 glycosyl hydrolase)
MVDSGLFSLQTLKSHPAMNPAAVIQGEHWRIGVLTEALIRFEWSDSGRFVDDATQMAVNRDFAGHPRFTAAQRDGWLEIDTPCLHLSYNMQRFTQEGMYATVKNVDAIDNTWHYGDVQRRNLGGTYRTLDFADGRIPVDPGVNSTDGWAVIDDSASNVIREAAQVNGKRNPFGTWVTPKDEPTNDFYLFAYGHRYREAVQDFYRLTGPTPLLPRFVFGNWWSRYHRYSEEEYRRLVERFEAEGIPFTTAVIDMDWHLVDDVDPQYGSGWTGYTWNRDLYPDPRRFLGWLHGRGMKTTLNVHPKDGIRAFEDLYPQVAKAMGVDPDTREAVQFDLTDPRFMETYFDQLHHPMEDDGVDFWWLDWQQGGVTRQKGLDPLWGLNHLHYLDSARDDGSEYSERNPRPLTFSRYAGPGSHRYPIGFSGDTVVTWQSLKFQPEFTATASNIGYGWWSHDIGGHMFGYRDEELEARWYQLGAFSPINRLHSTDSPFNGKEPWNFHAAAESAMVAALRLRHAMVPYLYTMNRRASYDNEPLVQPLYWDYPQIQDAYKLTDEFRFGTELLVAPIVDPMDRSVQMAKADVWLPRGEWFDFFDGRRYDSRPDAGRRLEAWRGLDRIPVFAKAGAIVPLQRPVDGEALNCVDNPRSLRIMVFPGANGSFTLWEDDGAPERAVRWASTIMTLNVGQGGDDGAVFRIEPVCGVCDVVPERRDWELVFRGVDRSICEGLAVAVDGVAVAADHSYDAATLSLTVRIPALASGDGAEVRFIYGLAEAANPVAEDAFAVLKDAQMYYLTKEKAYTLVKELGVDALPALATLEDLHGVDESRHFDSHMPQPVIQALAEVLTRAQV